MFKVIINEDGKIPKDDIVYIVAKDGIYLKKKIGIVDALVKVDKISYLKDVETYARLTIPKISEKLFGRILSFFREVYKVHKSEAAALIYFNQDRKEFKVEIPAQKVSFSKADYVRNKAFKDFSFLATVHSHSNFGAFHSGTDTSDEKNLDGLHITLGHVDEEFVDIASSVVINGERFSCFINEYIKDIKPVIVKSSYCVWNTETQKSEPKQDLRWKVKKVPFNPEWMKRVVKEKSSYEIDWGKYTNYRDVFFSGHLPYGNNDVITTTPLNPDKPPEPKPYNPCDECPFSANKVDVQDSPRFSGEWWETGE